MDPVPDTLNFMIAGYAVFWVAIFAFVVSLWARMRSLQKDMDVLRQMAEERHVED